MICFNLNPLMFSRGAFSLRAARRYPFLFMHKLSEKFLHLDANPEQFAVLITMHIPGSSANGEDGHDITVDDILGPLIRDEAGDVKLTPEGAPTRDDNLSLLSFSFNLNPAMRQQLSSVFGSFMSDSELRRDATLADSPAWALQRGIASLSKQQFQERTAQDATAASSRLHGGLDPSSRRATVDNDLPPPPPPPPPSKEDPSILFERPRFFCDQ